MFGISLISSGLFTTTNRRVNRLNILPNTSAIIVLVKMMTLYGILKSGVGRDSSKLVVRIIYAGRLAISSTVMTAGLHND